AAGAVVAVVAHAAGPVAFGSGRGGFIVSAAAGVGAMIGADAVPRKRGCHDCQPQGFVRAFRPPDH
ncbi:MAG: hypothetical protein KGO01_21845, partial [Burkholderiales bacterium]|nr:hypothetical protein [Burkholderiales bacterium]